MTTRRALLASLGAAALAGPGLAHTPYRQWVVYRRKHLLIGSHRGDEAGHALATAVAEALVRHLPDSRARVARAPAATRLAALLATDQLDLAVLTEAEAETMRDGAGVFAAYGALPLEVLVPLEDGRALHAHARFRSDHGALVAEALEGRAWAEP